MRFLRTISARLLGPAADMAADMAVEPAHHRVRRAAQPDARSEARSEAVPSGGFAPRTARALKPFGDAMGSAMSGAKDRLEDIGGGTGLTGQKQPEIGPTGIIDVGDDYFKQVCLLKDDGTMYVVKDRNTARLAEDLADLERQYEAAGDHQTPARDAGGDRADARGGPAGHPGWHAATRARTRAPGASCWRSKMRPGSGLRMSS